jgi:hypothetical protein
MAPSGFSHDPAFRGPIPNPVRGGAALGCGKSGAKGVTVKGKVVNADGAPFRDQRPIDKPLPPGDPGVRVKFTSLEATAEPGQPPPTFLARYDPDMGAFDVPGPEGKGIPAGKYRVTVHAGAAGENAGAPPAPSNVPPTVENAAPDDPGLDGKVVSQSEETVPPNGVTDLVLTVGHGK